MAMRAIQPASLELKFPANAGRAISVRRRLRVWLDQVGVSQDEAFEIVTAVSEAFVNAVEHAQNPSSPQIDVTAVVTDGGVMLAVRDHGSWRKEPRRPGGYGLLLMRTFMSTVEVHSASGTTTVTMWRELRGADRNGDAPPSVG